MEDILKEKKILFGITGSIAAYKTPYLVRELVKAGSEVKVIMTPSAKHFVSPLTLSNLSRNPAAIEMFEEGQQTDGAWHIQLAHWCDLMIIAPCSATTLSRIASGNCDTALSTLAIALPREIPLLIAPAMDSTMWLHPATQRNVNTVEMDGAVIIPPVEGELSSGLTGPGRLPETDALFEFIRNEISSIGKNKTETDIRVEHNIKSPDNLIDIGEEREKAQSERIQKALETPIPSLQDTVDKDKWSAEMELDRLKKEANTVSGGYSLAGKKVLITAGPTKEKIDDVRYISNHSSGKMGFALAEEALEAGAEVTLVAGPVNLDSSESINRIDVTSAEEMYAETVSAFPDADIAILAAAVSDYSPASPVEGKIKKQQTGNNLSVEFTSTKDILATLGESKKPGQILIGFALESDNEIENGRKKLEAKNCDMIIVNSANKPQSGFGGDDNTISILKRGGGEKSYPPMSKKMCAREILKNI